MRFSSIVFACLIVASPMAGWAQPQEVPLGQDPFPQPHQSSQAQDCASASADLFEVTPDKVVEMQRVESGQAAADPFSVSDSAQLFTRPTLGEIFKLSVETKEKAVAYSLVGTPGLIWDSFRGSRILSGLQGTASYTPDSRDLNVGLKMNYSMRDARDFVGKESIEELQKAVDAAFNECWNGKGKEGADVVSRIRRCKSDSAKAMQGVLRRKYAWRPAFSLGASIGRNFTSNRWGKFAANLAVDLPFGASGFSLVGNLDAESADVAGGRRWSTGGALAVNWQSPIDLRINFSGKYVACLTRCEVDSSHVAFGPRAEYPLAKDIVVAAGVAWKGVAQGVRESLVGLAVSYSFGPEGNLEAIVRGM